MEERGAKRASRSKLLKEDPGWLGPFNRMVWASPNCLLVVLLVIGSVACVVLRAGHYSANAFLGAAVVEILLSTDNICLFHQIFEHFKVPREVRPGLLFVGTPFMVAVRGVMFFALKEVYNSVRPIMFAIGLFCLYQGCYVIWVTCTGQDEDKDDPATSAVVVWGKWAFGDRLITHYEGSAFWVYVQGAAKLTPMFLCMAVIEVTDVMFCVDGVSTIFMVRLRVQGPRSSGWDPRSKVQGLYVGSRVRAPPPPRTKRRVKEARATPDEEESVRGASASMQRRTVRTRVLARFIANESRRSGCRCPHTTETWSSARTSQSRLGVYGNMIRSTCNVFPSAKHTQTLKP
mmetsp:Transcript_23704/g.58749  ORF Transcript_23704/g.58749 Transcript_23704/m.58749 type:complete len:346 (-) Transcript_23704:2039-3076(-)